jgi:CRISPR system Cascade subunit CasE
MAIYKPARTLCHGEAAGRRMRMFFSRIRLKRDAARERQFWKHIDGGYAMHSLIWDLFTDGPERARDFIYRQDLVEGLPAFYSVSKRVPNDRAGVWSVESKPYMPHVMEGQRLSFVLKANPIRTKRDENNKQHRHDVVMEAKTRMKEDLLLRPPEAEIVQQAGFVWLAVRAAVYGFSVSDGKVRADGYSQLNFVKPKGGKPVRISTIDFTGLLTVTDPEKFTESLYQGIGPAKGFGCGMMMVRPVR